MHLKLTFSVHVAFNNTCVFCIESSILFTIYNLIVVLPENLLNDTEVPMPQGRKQQAGTFFYKQFNETLPNWLVNHRHLLDPVNSAAVTHRTVI